MTTTARVTITLDILADGSWGNECRISQVREQAAESAVGHLNQLIQSGTLKAKIVGKPSVTAVMHSEPSHDQP